MAERLPLRVPENAEIIIRYSEKVFNLARRRNNLHGVRKWARRAAGNLRRAGRRREADLFDWLAERARLGLAHYPQEGPFSLEERRRVESAVLMYEGISIQAFEILMSRSVEHGLPFRRSMLAPLRRDG